MLQFLVLHQEQVINHLDDRRPNPSRLVCLHNCFSSRYSYDTQRGASLTSDAAVCIVTGTPKPLLPLGVANLLLVETLPLAPLVRLLATARLRGAQNPLAFMRLTDAGLRFH